MSENIWIQIRVKERSVKDAIDAAAQKRGRDTGPWLLYLASLADPKVAEAMSIDPQATLADLRVMEDDKPNGV